MIGKTWPWWQLWLGVKPKLRSTKFAEIKASLEAKTAEAEKKKEQEKQARQKAAVINEQVSNLVDTGLPIIIYFKSLLSNNAKSIALENFWMAL